MARLAPTRRETLTAATALVTLGAVLPLTGCSGRREVPEPSQPPEPTPAPDPDDALRREAVGAEEALIALHDATVARHPELSALLAPLTEHHRRHAAALGAALAGAAGGGSPGAAGTASASQSEPPSAAPPAVPDDLPTALDAVRVAEQGAAADRLRGCLASTDESLAVLLASAGAAEAAHAALIGRPA